VIGQVFQPSLLHNLLLRASNIEKVIENESEREQGKVEQIVQ
jgi:hypothetical protein